MMETLYREMEQYAKIHHVPIIRPEAADVLLQAASQKRPKRILEIGTAIGYSTLRLAQCLAPGGKLTSIELSEERIEIAKAYIKQTPLASSISLLQGDAAEILLTLTDTYDFVFIDAAKGQYGDYLQKIIRVLDSEAVIAADNVLFRGYVQDLSQNGPRRYRTIIKRLRAFLQTVQNDSRFQVTIYPDGDGLAICQYRRKND